MDLNSEEIMVKRFYEWKRKLNEGHCCELLRTAIKLGAIHVCQYKETLYYDVEIKDMKRPQINLSINDEFDDEFDDEFGDYLDDKGLEYTARIYICPFCHKELPKIIVV